MSAMTTVVAPDTFAMAATSKPTVPAPKTIAVSPCSIDALRVAWIATESGSKSAAASIVTWDGILVESLSVLTFLFRRFMQDILMAPLRRVVDAFLEGSLEVRHRLGTTAEPHPRAKVISTSLTRPTIVTRHTNLQCHTVANLEAGYGFSDGNDDTCRLVPQRQRHDRLEISITELVVVRHVTATDPRGFDSYLKLMGGGIRNSSSFLMSISSGGQGDINLSPTGTSGKCGMRQRDGESIRAANPLAHARR
jgi:hypothetical protein